MSRLYYTSCGSVERSQGYFHITIYYNSRKKIVFYIQLKCFLYSYTIPPLSGPMGVENRKKGFMLLLTYIYAHLHNLLIKVIDYRHTITTPYCCQSSLRLEDTVNWDKMFVIPVHLIFSLSLLTPDSPQLKESTIGGKILFWLHR